MQNLHGQFKKINAANPTQSLRADRVERKMSDSITVTRPIEIKDNSVERVAFDLMSRIAEAERVTGNIEGKKNNP